MGTMHEIIANHGKGAALLEFDRPEVEAAASYMADESSGIGFLYSGWCQAALPHRRLPDTKPWQIISDHVTLIVEPGNKPGPTEAIPIGVPYGSRARLIMLYLQAEALRTKSRRVELGRSMREWLHRMGIPQGGKSIGMIRDQAERISRCRLSFNLRGGSGLTPNFKQQNIVDEAFFLDHGDTDQGSLFLETAQLSELFYDQLQKHPVPLEESAVRAISNNSMALDLYAWTAYRLHAIKGPTPVSWSALKGQFGGGFGALRHFQPTFLDNLKLALAVYPKAKVELTERGVTLLPSPPPVAPKIISSGGAPTSAFEAPALTEQMLPSLVVSIRQKAR